MNILVTGGAGYIGSHTAKALARAGHRPIVLDNLSRGYRTAVNWGPLIEGDIADRILVTETLRYFKIDAVLHFAAFAYIGESMSRPGIYFENNSFGSLRLLEAMQDAGVDKIVFSSTCATYGNPQVSPIDESHPQNPINAYGESKLIVERLLQWYGRVHKTSWVALRYFNAAGADPDGELGENHEPETHLIPLVLEAVINPDTPVSIFGSDYPTCDGTALRDYIHVSDLADAHVRAVEYLGLGGESRPFNLGSGRGSTVRQIIRAVAAITGKAPAVIAAPRRLGDPSELIADPALAFRVLGWEPTSSLDYIIRTAWNWRLKRESSVNSSRA
jgi:UDP-arabinose 4-epimerase